MRGKEAVKAEEASRYLGYFGCETRDLVSARRPGLLSTRHLPVVMGVLCALILVGMAVYAARPHESSAILAQERQSISEDSAVVSSPLDTGASLNTSQASGSAADSYYLQHISPECNGPWYPFLVGLLACRGG
jgi:hypothetical protein